MRFDFIESQAASNPDSAALWFDDNWFTYADLNQRAIRLANRLHEFGIRRGDRVAILALNHIAHFDLMLAATKLGHVHMPFNHRLALQELRELAGQIKPSLLLVDPAHEAAAETLGLAWLRLSDYEAWLAGASPEPQFAPPALSPDDLHMILFTSGSAGMPKGACLPYRQTLGNAADTVAVWGLSADDCAIQCTPCFHAAVNALSLPLLLSGGRVLLISRFDPSNYLQLAAQHDVSLLFMVPSMFRALADAPGFAETPLPRLRWAVSGGAPCPPSLRERFAARGIALRQGYGMTEAGVNCFHISSDEAAQHPGSVGRTMPNIVLVLRQADGAPVTAADEVGEITLAGPQICAGYFFREDADAEAQSQSFRDGWLWTGDLASCDAQGLVTIRGRRKDLYISGGENIHPAEVEAALSQCAGVAECSVFGWPHEKWGECGVALIVARPDAPPDAAALRLELRTRIAGYKMPSDLLFIDALPKSAAGKIVKREVRALYAATLKQHADHDLSAAA